MGTRISLFSGYSQKENRTTNYCMLMLKMLYEENPKYLSSVMSSLISEEVGDYVGVKFYQQTKKDGSIPDGFISQKPFAIYIETKTFDWFYDDQLKRHLEALNQEGPGLKVLIALGNFEMDLKERFPRIQQVCRTEYQGAIAFAGVTFEDFLGAIKQIEYLPKNLADAVSDFQDYLNEENLLPAWEGYIDVVNCVGLPEDVLQGNVYMCPATGGSYNHSRCKYFGMYRYKKVEKVAVIEAVVDVESETEARIKWKNVKKPDEALKVLAIEKVINLRGEYPTRIFLLGDLFDTEFIKDTKGGMMGSKQYFDISSLGAKDASELATALKGRTWSNV